MKNKLKYLILTVVLSTLILGNSLVAFAAEVASDSGGLSDNTISYIEANYGSKGWSKISGYFSSKQSSGDNTIVITDDTKTVVYYYKSSDVDNINKAVKSTQSSQDASDALQNITDGLELTPDTEGATEILSGVTPVIRTLIGLLVILITLGMTVVTAFDICYLVFPVLRNKMEDSKNSGGAMGKKGADGSVSLRIVTDEAQFAVQQVATNPGVNPMSIYFRKRIFSYIILTILLFILLTGNVTIITDLVLKLVSGLLNIIQGLG